MDRRWVGLDNKTAYYLHKARTLGLSGKNAAIFCQLFPSDQTVSNPLVSFFEWGNELGEPCSNEFEDVMDKGHDILKASKDLSIHRLLDGVTITEYLGADWVKKHQSVLPYINMVEKEL